jgi:hypothetical protein
MCPPKSVILFFRAVVCASAVFFSHLRAGYCAPAKASGPANDAVFAIFFHASVIARRVGERCCAAQDNNADGK